MLYVCLRLVKYLTRGSQSAKQFYVEFGVGSDVKVRDLLPALVNIAEVDNVLHIYLYYKIEYFTARQNAIKQKFKHALKLFFFIKQRSQ